MIKASYKGQEQPQKSRMAIFLFPICDENNRHIGDGRQISRLSEIKEHPLANCMLIQRVEFTDISTFQWQEFFKYDTRTWSSIELDDCGGHVDVFLRCILPKTQRFELKRSFRENVAAIFSLGLGLKFNTILTELVITETTLWGLPPSILAEGIGHCRKLKTLKLNQCEVPLDVAISLSSGIRLNKSLLAFSIHECVFEDEAYAKLLSSAKLHPSLKTLHVTPDDLDGHIALTEISNWLQQTVPTNKVLVLRRATVESTTCDNILHENPAFVETLMQQTSLQKLGFGMHVVSDKDMPCVRRILERATTLQNMKLDANSITDLSELALALSHPNCNLVSLDLANNEINDASITSFAAALPNFTSLKRLVLTGNRFGDNGMQALTESLEHNFLLEDLVVLNNEPCPKVHHFVGLNRGGRRVLREKSMRTALWPLVLERASNRAYYDMYDRWDEPTNYTMGANVIFSLLRESPMLFEECRRGALSSTHAGRKRMKEAALDEQP